MVNNSIKESLDFVFGNWITEKASANKIMSENIFYNKELKKTGIEDKTYNKQKRTFQTSTLKTSQKIVNDIPKTLYQKSNISVDSYKIEGSISTGRLSEIIWIGLFDRNITTSAQNGYYIVYLFRSDMKGVYMSLNQGWTQYKNTYGSKDGKLRILKTSKKLKEKLRSVQGFNFDPIELNTDRELGVGYERGNICSKYYEKDKIPNDNILIDDLRNLIGVYRELNGIVGNNILDIDGLYEESEFQEEVQSGKKLKLPDGGVSRLNKKDKKKGSSSWKRNENYSFMAIEDSQFLCENDPNHSTFISRKSGKQFMEAHHLIPMEFYDYFQYSIDIPENIISLCPNCHSLFHYSENNFRNKIIEKFYNKRRELLKKRKIDIDLNKLKGYYNDKNNA